MAKRARCCSSSSDFSTPNWAGLDPDLLGLILQKLVYIPDFIRFTSVCKPWNSLASTVKEKRLNNKHQLPWLLLSSLTTIKKLSNGKLELYNFTSNQRCNFQIRNKYNCCYSSHGWLITSKMGSSLILSNPLSGAIIHLPPIWNKIVRKGDIVMRVILSRDPSSGSFDVLAYCLFNVVAHLKNGDKFWTYSSGDIFPPIVYHDIAFYKDRMLGVTQRGGILSIDVVDGGGDESSKIKISEIAPALLVESPVQGYFVETTKGDLLMVYRYYNYSDHKSEYEIYKLIIDSNGKLERIPIVNLGGESLFLGKHCTGISVLASNYPGCMPNRIYCGVHFTDDLDQHKVEVFNLEDKSIAASNFPKGCSKSIFPTWLVPTMKL